LPCPGEHNLVEVTDTGELVLIRGIEGVSNSVTRRAGGGPSALEADEAELVFDLFNG
jgi:hypothetical protein